ncbi:MAG: PQQ-binding-like beta-propeller repeat protein [Candidatus Brocadiae bacterium]|nr:PQQ-binding-like beta-propeller repeat protein [Candidatus Brocadiia bacterium]
MKRLFAPALLLLILAATTMALADDWPRFWGPTANGKAPDTGINKDWGAKPPAVLWQTNLTDDGYAGPSVADGKVFIIDHKGAEDVVRAIDFETGQDLWSFAYADPGGANYGYAHSTPCYDNGTLYTLGRKGQLHALNAEDGQVLWSLNLVQNLGGQVPTWNYASSPIVDGDRLVVLPGGANNVAVLNKETGETIWAGGGAFPAGYATPAIATINGVKQYVVFAGNALTGVSAEDGTLLWQVPWETRHGVNSAVPIVEGEFVFASSGYAFGCGVFQITANGPQQVWFNKAMQMHFNSPVYHEGYIYGTTDPGDLVCVAPRDGTVIWRQGGFEKGGIVVVDGTIIALNGGGGDLIMVEASTDGYKELGRIKPLGDQSWTAPVVADGKLLIRNKAVLACFDLM